MATSFGRTLSNQTEILARLLSPTFIRNKLIIFLFQDWRAFELARLQFSLCPLFKHRVWSIARACERCRFFGSWHSAFRTEWNR